MKSNLSAWMAAERTTPVNFVFGNARWNVTETPTVGVLQFVIPTGRSEANVARVFQITLSEARPYRRDRIIYAPHVYTFERNFDRGRRRARLFFPPGRNSAALLVDSTAGGRTRTQLLLKTWTAAQPKDEEIFYPHLDEQRRRMVFRKEGFHFEIRFRFGPLGYLTASEGWHGTRVGFETQGAYAVLFAFGLTAAEARAEMNRLERGLDGVEETCRSWWNAYFASCPLVELKADLAYRNAVFGARRILDADTLLRRQLWHYYHALASVVDAPWCAASPLQTAERFHFNDSFCNDNTYGAMLLSLTGQHAVARGHLLNLMRHMLYPNGHFIGCIDYMGHSKHGDLNNGVPSLSHAIGHYIRCTGDATLLDEDAGGMTVWRKLKRWEERVLPKRDSNGDGLIEWNIVWESGEDNKDTAFFKKKGLMEWYKQYQIHGRGLTRTAFYRKYVCPTTTLNEQAFYLWSLEEMAYLATLRGEDPRPYRDKARRIVAVLSRRHWNPKTGFYHDYDVKAGRLWHAKNLDAFYVMYFESDARRSARLVRHLQNPEEFNLSLLPTLSRDDVHFDPESYWAGAAWPREHGFVAIALDRQGYSRLALEWIARALCCAEGPVIPEFTNPLSDPPKLHGNISGMVMASVNQVVLLDIAGMRTWSAACRQQPSTLPLMLHAGQTAAPAAGRQ